MTAKEFKEKISTETWITWILAAGVYTAAALVFMFSTFVTQSAQGKLDNWMEARLARIEQKLDRLLELRN